MERRLGILILSNPQGRDLETMRGICQAAMEMGVEVEVFFMGDGVYHIADPRLEEPTKWGVNMSFCALNAMQRHMNQHPQYPWGIDEGSQFHLACIVERAQRFLAFT